MNVNGQLEFGSLDATLNRVPFALTLSNLSEKDQPLLFMNTAFRAITGCTDKHLGQNCRFLQSDLENEQARAEIRLALLENRRTQVILKNRRMDGEQFHNLLLLEPIAEFKGFPKLALGAQFELSQKEVSELEVHGEDQVYVNNSDPTDMALKLRLERRRIAATSSVQLLQSWLTLNSLENTG